MAVRHVLESGECLQSLASAYGLADGKQIYDAPDNAALRKQRKSPAAVAPGDEVSIPEPKKYQATLPSNEVHRIVLDTPKAMLRIEVRDEAGEPLASKPYQLMIGKETLEGTTTGAGLVEQPIPLSATEGTLVVHEKASKDEGRWSWRLKLADLEGPETRRGAWQRLANLGYWSAGAPPDDSAGPGDPARDAFTAALRAFQHAEALDESGQLDDATRARLVERHGI
jgi:hypothetical protein